MSTQTSLEGTTVHSFDSLAYVNTDPMPRDQQQSGHLHEPQHMVTTIDPISGRDIGELEGKPFLKDEKLTIYFESEETKQAYVDMPMEHHVPLADNPVDEWVAEG